MGMLKATEGAGDTGHKNTWVGRAESNGRCYKTKNECGCLRDEAIGRRSN